MQHDNPISFGNSPPPLTGLAQHSDGGGARRAEGATLTDHKLPHTTNNQSIDYYLTDITSAQDYYPGGMLMPGRSYSSDSYRFGMNGQEKDDEIAGNGNIYSALYWEYDGRSLRRWNLDPVTIESISPYSCFEGNSIWYSDPNGDYSRVWAWLRSQIYGDGSIKKVGKEWGYYTSKEIKEEGCNVPGIEQTFNDGSQKKLQRKFLARLDYNRQIDEWTRQGIWDPNLTKEQARNNFINNGLTVMLPTFIKGAGATNTTKTQVTTTEAVYDITLQTGERYIGQSKNWIKRLLQHTGKYIRFNYTEIKSKVIHAMPGSTPLEREVYEQYLIDNIGIENLANVRNPMGGRMEQYKELIESVITKYKLPRKIK